MYTQRERERERLGFRTSGDRVESSRFDKKEERRKRGEGGDVIKWKVDARWNIAKFNFRVRVRCEGIFLRLVHVRRQRSDQGAREVDSRYAQYGPHFPVILR
jgi:hypothetical protein